MSHTITRGSYSIQLQMLMELILQPQNVGSRTYLPHTTSLFYRLDRDIDPATGKVLWNPGDIHGAIDINYEYADLNVYGTRQIYAPIAGTLVFRDPLNENTGTTAGHGSIVIRDDYGVGHAFFHLHTFSQDLLNLTVDSGRVNTGMVLGTMGGMYSGKYDAYRPHVHYEVIAPGFVATNASTWNRIDPVVYWTPGVNPNATGPTATGLYAYATPVVDQNTNGIIDDPAPGTAPSEIGAVVKEGGKSFLKVGVNTPHTRPIELRLQFTGAPAGFRAVDRSGAFAVQWNDTEKAAYVTLPATLNQSTPNVSTLIELLMPEEDNDPKNEFLTYTVTAGYLDSNNQWWDYNQTATLVTPASGNLSVLEAAIRPSLACDPVVDVQEARMPRRSGTTESGLDPIGDNVPGRHETGRPERLDEGRRPFPLAA